MELEVLRSNGFPKRFAVLSGSLLCFSPCSAVQARRLSGTTTFPRRLLPVHADRQRKRNLRYRSKSVGGEASFRHSFHPLLGFEAAYDYSRFTESYTGQAFGYQHNLHVFSGSYYVHGPKALGIQPFALAGISAAVFSPSLNGGQNVPYQVRPLRTLERASTIRCSGAHRLRIEYRGLYYQAPDFGLQKLTTNAYRLMSEPMAGVYIHF